MSIPATELNEARNQSAKLWSRMFKEGLAITIAATGLFTTLIISSVSIIVANNASNDAKEARIRVELQDQEIQQLRDEIGVAGIRYDKLRLQVEALGVVVEN